MAFSGGNQICISSPINSQKSTAKPEELDGAAIAFLDDKKTGRQMAMDAVDHWIVSIMVSCGSLLREEKMLDIM